MIERLEIEKDRILQYKKIKEDKNPIFVWGVGALAIDVYRYCMAYGIRMEGFFVDEYKADTTFMNHNVFTMDEVLDKYSEFSVIIGHSEYAEGSRRLEKINQVKNIYCLSSASYDIFRPISLEFIEKEAASLDAFYQDLKDSRSKSCLLSYLESRINENPQYMFPYFQQGENFFVNDVISLGADETLLDVGACCGQAIWKFAEAVNDNYRLVIALEPDENNYLELLKNIETRKLKKIITKQVCAYNRNKEVRFEGSMELGGIKSESETYKIYPAVTIDSLCKELKVELTISVIKINFPFSVSEVLDGGSSLLRNRKPNLIIRVGFDEQVLLKTYLLIKNINPKYEFYLRYTLGIPQGLTLFAV